MNSYTPQFTNNRASLFLPSKYGKSAYYLTDLVMVESDRNYSKLYFKCGNNMIISKTLALFEQYLEPHGFLRINRSQLLNINYIDTSYKVNASMQVRTKNGKYLNISRRKFKDIKNKTKSL